MCAHVIHHCSGQVVYGGPVGRGCHDVLIRDLRTCTHACTSGICGLAHTRFADVHTCTSGICGLAHTRFAEVQCFHVVEPRGEHVVTTWKQLHFRKSRKCKSANPSLHVRKLRMCKSANPRCACVHVRKSSMCKSANPRCARPQIAYVHVMTAATYRATVGDTPPHVNCCGQYEVHDYI